MDSPADSPSSPSKSGQAFRRRIPGPLSWCLASFAVGAAIAGGVVYRATRPDEGTSPPGKSPYALEPSYITAYEIHRGRISSQAVWEITDGRTVQALGSMLAAEPQRSAASPPGPPTYTIRRRRLDGGEAPTIEIRPDGNGHVWTEEGRAYRLFGDFEAMVRALPAVRCAQMLESRRGNELSEGRRLRQAAGDELFDAQLAPAASENPKLQELAIWSLNATIRERSQFQREPVWEVGRDHRRSDSHPRAADVRRLTVSLLESLLRSPPADPADKRWFEAANVCRLSAEVADAGTADDMARLLAVEAHPRLTEDLMTVLETVYGLPSGYRPLLGCGLNTAAESAAMAAENTARRIPARDDLLKWHAANQGKDREARFDAVLAAWGDRLTKQPEGSSTYLRFPFHPEPLERLFQFGPELVPALKRRQAAAGDDLQCAGLEYVAAVVTGDCDAALVERLLAGDLVSQGAGCRIIGAAGQSKWSVDRLKPFLNLPAHDPNAPHNPRHVEALQEAAVFALLSCHGPGVVPLFETAHDRSQLAARAIRFYRSPTNPRF